MSLIFADGFDHYAAFEDLQEHYDLTSLTSASLSTSTAYARGKALVLPATINGYIGKSIPVMPLGATIGVSFRACLRSAPSSAAYKRLMSFADSNSVTQGILYVSYTNQLYWLGSGTSTEYFLPVYLNPGEWHNIEIKTAVHDSLGFVEVRVNGNTVLAYTGDTRNGGSGAIESIRMGNTNASNTGVVEIDDLVIWDTNGDTFNDWLGDVEVHSLLPTGTVSSTGFTAEGASTLHEAVDDPAEDTDTTYIVATEVDDVAVFSFGSLPVTPDKVLGVQLVALARKDDSGNRSIKLALGDGTDWEETADVGLGLTYAAASVTCQKPAGSLLNWTPEDVEDLQARVKVTV